MKNINKQYRVTYNGNDETFVVHRKEAGLPNKESQIHSLGLYVPNEIKSNITFINTV